MPPTPDDSGPRGFSGQFPSLPIVSPDPPRRSVAERYGALFYLGVAGLLILVALVGWFAWSAWSLRNIWTNVYVLHDETSGEPRRIQAALALVRDPEVNQRQLWDIALRRNVPPLARYIVAEGLTAEAAVADPRAYGAAVSKSEGWPDWLRLLLTRPMTLAAALGLEVDRDSLRELTRNPDPVTALWATAALAVGPEGDPTHAAELREAAETPGPNQELARLFQRAAECTREADRLALLDEATRWTRLHHPEAARLWAGWSEQRGE